jgi:hypothetical protein
MNTTIFTTSHYGNNYYLDFKKRLVGYAHPILSFVDNHLKQHGTLDNIPDAVDIDGVGRVNKETINYYIVDP